MSLLYPGICGISLELETSIKEIQTKHGFKFVKYYVLRKRPCKDRTCYLPVHHEYAWIVIFSDTRPAVSSCQMNTEEMHYSNGACIMIREKAIPYLIPELCLLGPTEKQNCTFLADELNLLK